MALAADKEGARLKALVLNCSLKPGTQASNIQLLANVLVEALEGYGVDVTVLRLADLDVWSGVVTDVGTATSGPKCMHRSGMPRS